jgi:hypothetical protein
LSSIHTPRSAASFSAGLATPGFGAGTAGTLGGRLATGAAAGAIGGGLYGAGSAIGEGGGTEEALRSAMSGAALGAPFGAAVKGVIGPGVLDPALARAAQTARELGPGAPRGLVSGFPGAQQLTSSLQSVPLAGHKITENVRALQEAAGERVGDIASGMTPAGRDVADSAVRSGLQSAIDANKQEANTLYGAVAAKFHPDTVIDTPQLRTALQGVIDRRTAKKQTNPEAGLDQFLNAVTDPNGITFAGARGLRSDARDAGDLVTPHPGFNSADFNRLAAALSGDLRVAAHRHGAGPEFDTAEKRFAEIAAQNTVLNKILRSGGQSAIDTLTGAARAGAGGNVKLLEQLRQTMPPAEFEKIGGTILHELGAAPSTGEFSLDRFVTGWNKLSTNAKQAMFSAPHLKAIDDIVNMGQVFKKALATANKGHTAQAIILWELARDAAEFGAGVAAGLIPLHAAAVSAAGAVGLNLFTRWMASPSKAASMGVWSRALQGFLRDDVKIGHAVAFRTATRNLAHQLRMPVESIYDATSRAITADGRQSDTVTLTPVEHNPHTTVNLVPVEGNPHTP